VSIGIHKKSAGKGYAEGNQLSVQERGLTVLLWWDYAVEFTRSRQSGKTVCYKIARALLDMHDCRTRVEKEIRVSPVNPGIGSRPRPDKYLASCRTKFQVLGSNFRAMLRRYVTRHFKYAQSLARPRIIYPDNI
jgi:hypothetical protein